MNFGFFMAGAMLINDNKAPYRHLYVDSNHDHHLRGKYKFDLFFGSLYICGLQSMRLILRDE